MWATNLKILGVTLAVLGLYTAIAHVIPQLESDVPEALDLSAGASPEMLAAAGERIYNGAGVCSSCHGLGTRAPNLLTDHAGQGAIGARCEAAFGAGCKDYLFTSLTEPGDTVVPGFENIMADQRRQLSVDQIWAAVAFLQSQGGTITVTADDIGPTSGDAAPAATTVSRTPTTDPRQLLTENACLGCHQFEGGGPPVAIGPAFDGMGARISADQIRRGIVDPAGEAAAGFEQSAGMMPPIFGDQLSATQLEVIVQFLASQR